MDSTSLLENDSADFEVDYFKWFGNLLEKWITLIKLLWRLNALADLIENVITLNDLADLLENFVTINH